MPAITPKERIKISHKLKQMGFGGVDDPNLFAQIATLYPNHNSFRGLLMSTAPDQRHIAYEALRPHLSFTPKPLDVYEREIHEKAEREQWDTLRPGEVYPEHFKVQDISLDKLATDAIRQSQHEKSGGKLEMVCSKCRIAGLFPASTRREAEKDAQREGWRWAERNGTLKTYCPRHVPERLTMTLLCSNCNSEEKLRAWDEQDGYAAARLRGWIIEESASCPDCSVKKLTIQ